MYVIVKDHKDFLVINKGAGISFHKDSDFSGLPALLRKNLGISQLFPVHRLDKMTSGLLVFAKNKKTAQELGNEFAAGKVEKYYLAISDQKPKKKQGLIKGDMVRSRRGTWKLLRSFNNPAITRFVSKSLGDGFRLFIMRPFTGKTHQLRVALKSIGAPAFGDILYHTGNAEGMEPDRGYLHSFSLAFHLSGFYYHFICPPEQGKLFSGPSFLEILPILQEPWTFFPKK